MFFKYLAVDRDTYKKWWLVNDKQTVHLTMTAPTDTYENVVIVLDTLDLCVTLLTKKDQGQILGNHFGDKLDFFGPQIKYL